jgi:hypothetical protein
MRRNFSGSFGSGVLETVAFGPFRVGEVIKSVRLHFPNDMGSGNPTTIHLAMSNNGNERTAAELFALDTLITGDGTLSMGAPLQGSPVENGDVQVELPIHVKCDRAFFLLCTMYSSSSANTNFLVSVESDSVRLI